jgi:alkaline phosphatase D
LMQTYLLMRFYLLLLCCFVIRTGLAAQERSPTFNPLLKPFYHGVASGQPTTDGFVIWTRLAPDYISQPNLQYFISDTPNFQTIIKSGTVTALEIRDYSAHFAISGLQPGKFYYYYFKHPEGNSLVGRAKTLPLQTNHARFAIMSCARYETGYFNAYGAIAKRNDLDAVVHLGDYIYEYAPFSVLAGREILPDKELLTLSDYRTRYATYRLDSNLIRMHQQHTFISVWDDHESANNSHEGGAENHQANEGDWELRKAIAKQVYREWMPITIPETTPIYRGYQYGALANLLMLDTRLDGREPQPQHFDSPDLGGRKIMSDDQFQWLTNALKDQSSRWKILGNQVIFSDLHFGMIAGAGDGQPDPTNLDSIRVVEDRNTDIWEAYPAQRDAILDTIALHNIPGVVITTGDSHASWVFDVPRKPVLYPLPQFNYLPQLNTYEPAKGGYDYITRAGALAVEFGVPSISSPNFDENFGTFQAAILEQVLLTPVSPPNPAYNPHLKYCDLDRHGYVLLDVKPDTIQANYYYLNHQQANGAAEQFGAAYYNVHGKPGAFLASTPSANATNQALPAPTLPPGVVSTQQPEAAVAFGTVYPNPARDWVFVHLVANAHMSFDVLVADAQGRTVQRFENQQVIAGANRLSFQLQNHPNGAYFLIFEGNGGRSAIPIVLHK